MNQYMHVFLWAIRLRVCRYTSKMFFLLMQKDTSTEQNTNTQTQKDLQTHRHSDTHGHTDTAIHTDTQTISDLCK